MDEDTDAHLDEYLLQCLDTIDRCGHMVQLVDGDDRFGDVPFAYTVGLCGREEAGYELAVSGLGYPVAGTLLNLLARELARGGPAPRAGLAVQRVLNKHTVRLREAGPDAPVYTVDRIYGMRPTVWQMLWPDEGERYPGDPGYDDERHPQPLL